MMGTQLKSADVEIFARDVGFDIVGITSADPFIRYEKIVKERTRIGLIPSDVGDWEDLRILQKPGFFSQPRNNLPDAKSIVSLAICYFTQGEKDSSQPGNPCGRIARSYWRCFYQDASERAEIVATFLRNNGIRVVGGHIVPHKLVAVRARVGWYGKNGVVQTASFGSWIILRSLVIDAELEEDERLKNNCGTCEACIKACPTSAIVAPYVVDIGRCINYFAAKKGEIPENLRGLMGNHVASCDDCLEACPRNKKVAPITRHVKRIRVSYGTSPSLISLLEVTEGEFQKEFYDLDWAEPKLKYLLRDVAIALGNSRDRTAIPYIKKLLKNSEKTVRSHASWAAKKLSEVL